MKTRLMIILTSVLFAVLILGANASGVVNVVITFLSPLEAAPVMAQSEADPGSLISLYLPITNKRPEPVVQPTSVVLPSPTPLPTVTQVPPPPQPAIQNGNFASGPVAWTQYSYHGLPLIVHRVDLPVPPRVADWAGLLGGPENEISLLEQQVTIPPDRPYLRYWHWIASEEVCGYDVAGVLINDEPVAAYWLCSANNTGGWQSVSVNLSSLAGQTVLLGILAGTDETFKSLLLLDDVNFGSTPMQQMEHSQGDTTVTLDAFFDRRPDKAAMGVKRFDGSDAADKLRRFLGTEGVEKRK